MASTSTPRASNEGLGSGPRTPRSRRPTAADVARRAGFSRATVSYVLNNTPHQVLPESTRQRVLQAASELGYTPSAAARALSSGRSDVVLLLLPDWPIGPSVGALLESLSMVLADHGFTFLTHPRAAGRSVADVWRAITPAAVLTFEQLDPEETAGLTSAGIDLTVALFEDSRRGSAMSVSEQRTGRLQAEHLAAAGHHRLGYAWPDDHRVETFAGRRLEGVRRACVELNLPEPVVQTVPLDPRDAAVAIDHWRGEGPPVTGVCAYNDDVAMAVLAGARERAVTVPQELAVVGVDDVPTAGLTTPALTTIQIDRRAMSEHIAGLVVSKINGTTRPRRPGSNIHAVICRESA